MSYEYEFSYLVSLGVLIAVEGHVHLKFITLPHEPELLIETIP